MYDSGLNTHSLFLKTCVCVREGIPLTVKTLTSLRLRTSSTRASGLPLEMGMVPRIEQLGLSRHCLTARMKGWLNSSILPISSITKTFLPPPWAGEEAACVTRKGSNGGRLAVRVNTESATPSEEFWRKGGNSSRNKDYKSRFISNSYLICKKIRFAKYDMNAALVSQQ